MDSAKFQDHGRYDLKPTGEAEEGTANAGRPREESRPRTSDAGSHYVPLHPEPPAAERRAAGPGWDPLSVDEEAPKKEAPRTSGPDTDPPTRY
jgi:hypothetical protein